MVKLTTVGSQDGAFDGVLDGLDAILHTASPFYVNVDDPEGTQMSYGPVLHVG
jgi:hypothetical protein